ncbi:helix-turn-helix transcriptional regulator [Clostridium sp. 'deep sea']|uniref:helix-turn-helix transcriptional regulator n=1 Tax=Clostridium sp. 'deep sea' TaxID=2779445 RepID=UPI0018964939|nr:helix-turn-helix transcriptional regulator [Clostridium sp. 'deep sea']QOR33849.1 helix-turn-helix transcriptional regulator [Clostridium sp. 'deep sea']
MHTKLRYLRKQKRVSTETLAELLSLKSIGAYYKKEVGDRNLTLQEAKILSDYFGSSIEQLFFDKQSFKVAD